MDIQFIYRQETNLAIDTKKILEINLKSDEMWYDFQETTTTETGV